MNRHYLASSFTIAPYSDLVTQAGTIGTMEYSAGGSLIDDNWIGREYEWDQFNRVTMVKNGSGTPLYGFEYGGTGERTVQNTYSGGLVSSTRAFLYDREYVIAEFSNDTFATVFRQYIHGPGIDEPLAILGDDVGEYTYYLHDGLGSVTGVVDENGKLGAIDYSAFGETRSSGQGHGQRQGLGRGKDEKRSGRKGGGIYQQSATISQTLNLERCEAREAAIERATGAIERSQRLPAPGSRPVHQHGSAEDDRRDEYVWVCKKQPNYFD